MNEAVSSTQSKAGKPWLDVAKRILVAVIIVLAGLGLIVNVAGLAGVWTAYGPARSAVTDVSSTMTQALQVVDNGLARVNDHVQNARQTLTRVNDEATQIGDHIQASSPLITALSQRVDNELAPRIENARTTAVAIHDAVVKVNGALVALNRFPSVTVPTLSSELGSVSERAQEAQAAVQDLRVTLANIKAGIVTKAESAVMQVTSRIDAPLARIQALVNMYQVKAASTQERISSTTDTILTLIVALAVTLTLLLLIFAAGLVLLIYVCWQYVRTGRFPSLRVVRT